MKAQPPKPTAVQAEKKQKGQFASEADFLAEKNRRFQEVFGKIDWEKAKIDGLIL